MKNHDVEDDREEGTVRESLADLQKELESDELGATVVHPSGNVPMRATPPHLAAPVSRLTPNPSPPSRPTPLPGLTPHAHGAAMPNAQGTPMPNPHGAPPSGPMPARPTPMPGSLPNVHAAPVRPTPMPGSNAHAAPVRPTPMPGSRPNAHAAPARPTPMPGSNAHAAPMRSTPMPGSMPVRQTPMPGAPPVVLQPAPPPRASTPPYGAEIPRSTGSVDVAPSSSGFDETVLGIADGPDVSDSFSDGLDGATVVAAAAYDAHAAQAMMFVNTPHPQAYEPAAYEPDPYAQEAAYPQQSQPQYQSQPYSQPYPAQPYPAQPSYPPTGGMSPSGPMARPSFRPSVPYQAVDPTPTPPPADNPDLAQRLARLQALSLERPAVSAPTMSGSSRSGIGGKLPWILLALVVIGGGIYHVRSLREAEQGAKTAPAASNTPSTEPSARAGSLLASGYIAAKSPITLSATSSGRIDEVTVAAGDTITKGQLLARLGDGNIRAELSLAAARVRDASRQHQRTAMLVKAQAATPTDLERAFGAVEVARAEMRVIQQKLEDTRIRSPINGTVLEVLARPGESLTIGANEAAGILRIADLSALIAEVDIAEAELKNVRIGQEAEVTSEAQRTRVYRGVVSEIAEQADRARGTVLVKVDILPDLPEVPEGAGSADPGGGSAATTPPPEKKAEASKEPPRTRNARRKKAPKKAPKAPPKVPEVKPTAPPPPPPTGLRPGMAVQVRFLAKEEPKD